MDGGPVLIENKREGGDSKEEAREGEGRRGSVCGEEGGEAKFFFFRAEMPTKKCTFEKCTFVPLLET